MSASLTMILKSTRKITSENLRREGDSDIERDREIQTREDKLGSCEKRNFLLDSLHVKNDLRKYMRSAEKAVKDYNAKHKGAKFKLREIISANSFFSMGIWEHINFTASEDGKSLKLFFAELSYGEAHWGRNHKPVTEAEITACSLLEEGSTKDYCGFCPHENKIYHPLQGFTAGIRW